MNAADFVYSFGQGDGKNKMLLGGKGANLCEMTQIGIEVPPGFVISTAACLAYQTQGCLPAGLMEQARLQLGEVEQKTGKRFGSPVDPLLVSVRSGSAMSMPGMMDTILNLGLNQKTLGVLIAARRNPRFAHDAWCRFVQLFAKVALGVPDEAFDAAMSSLKQRVGAAQDVDLASDDLKALADDYLAIVHAATGKPFPSDPWEQLEIAIGAVFRSWMGKREVDYRRQFRITPQMANGTAVNVVAMVFGNMGEDSATGVGFTRNPGTGENLIYGEYLVDAQGEDVVAGIHTPRPIADMASEMPALYPQLLALRDRLEEHFREVQDFEFTIERGRLYCLQTRNGKMNAQAMLRTSVDMVREGLIDKERALTRIQPALLEQLLVPTLAPGHCATALAQGLPASPGAASGRVVFDADTAEMRGRQGERLILVREETKPEDIHGFFAAAGILTSRGGKTSHAAVVARGMGKPCVSGCAAIAIDVHERVALTRLLPMQREDFKGIFRAMAGLPVTIRLLDPPIHEFLPTAAQLEFEIAHLHHLARAVSSMDELPDKLKLLDPDLRKSHLHELEKLGLALREFHSAGRDNALLARKEAMLRKVRQLVEVNPMLGHRGVRLGITNPEIYAMQIRAILEAAAECRKEGIAVIPEITVPQVAALVELEKVRGLIDEIVPEVEAAAGVKVPFRFGSMLEVVRACVRAGELAGVAEFFSFGTNDLTQATFSFSRVDAENKFLPAYLELGVLKENPFEALDVKGVGAIMEMAVDRGRAARPDLAIGICGEHGGHPESIRFCHHLGLDYVSCSALRVPIARLAAAQARLLEKDYGAVLGD